MNQFFGGLTLLLGIVLLGFGIHAVVTRRASVRNTHPARKSSARVVTGRPALLIGILYLVMSAILVPIGLMLLGGAA